jgi:hypothetical protein
MIRAPSLWLLASHLGQGQGLSLAADELGAIELRFVADHEGTHDHRFAHVRVHDRPPGKEGKKRQSDPQAFQLQSEGLAVFTPIIIALSAPLPRKSEKNRGLDVLTGNPSGSCVGCKAGRRLRW